MRAFLVPLLPFAAVAAAPPAGPATTVTVVIEGVRTATGRVHADLCTRDTFLKQCAVSGEAAAQPGAVTITLRNVPPGTYAVQAYHDANGNGKLDRNWIGVPKEDVAFSRLTRLPYRAPNFAETSFEHGATDQRVPVKLSRYF